MKSWPEVLTLWASRFAEGKGWLCIAYLARRPSLSNTGCLVNSRNAISPSDHISAANGLPREINPCNSGAIKPRVPFRSVDWAVSSSRRLLMPKSPILTHHGRGEQDLMRMFWIWSQMICYACQSTDKPQVSDHDERNCFHAYKIDLLRSDILHRLRFPQGVVAFSIGTVVDRRVEDIPLQWTDFLRLRTIQKAWYNNGRTSDISSYNLKPINVGFVLTLSWENLATASNSWL